ncbi:MAG: POTRA domain-containing protein, partial [Bdellovibrionota bacterium]
MRLIAILCILVWAVPTFAARETVELDRVEVSGVTVFAGADIEGLLEINPGEKLERIKVVRTAENLQAYYRMKGYEEVSIRSRAFHRKGERGIVENVLEFNVTEGQPTRIAAVEFLGGDEQDESSARIWKKVAAELKNRAGFNPGDIYDQERIATSKRNFQETLASEEYIGARADDVRIIEVAEPKGIPEAKRKASRWVRLEFHVNLGDRVTFGFRGNAFLNQQELKTIVDDQRSVGLGKEYVGVIRKAIEDEYRSIGFAQAKVTPYTFEHSRYKERHVTYVIDEGPRVVVDSIDFDGNIVFSSKELRREFLNHASQLIQTDIYFEKDIQKAADLLIEWIKSRGYLAAKLVTISTVFPVKAKTKVQRSSVKITIYLYEGQQTVVHSVNFTGIKVFSVEEVTKMLSAYETEPLNLFAFTDGIETLKSAYRGKGYLSAQIVNENSEAVIKYSQENRTAEIFVDVSEGPLFKVSRIQIEGLINTKENIVQRQLEFKAGDILEESKITETEANLRRLGLFSVISIKLFDDPERKDGKIVRVLLQEGTPGYYGMGIGIRNDLGPRVFGRAGYSNLWNRNHSAFGSVAANRRLESFRLFEYQAQVGYIWPWFVLDEMAMRVTGTVSQNQYLLFDSQTRSGAVTFDFPLVKSRSFMIGLTYNLESIRQFNAPDELDNGDLRVGSLTPSLRLDLRDHPLSPTKGFYSFTS